MRKTTIRLKPETDQKLRLYVSKKYPTETYGKIGQVVEEAINQFIESPDEKTKRVNH